MRSQIQSLVTELLSLVDKHQEWRGSQTINLIPSENITSLPVRKLLGSDLGHRYTAPDRFYQGTEYLDEIELLGIEVAKQVFRARFADLRPLSGHMAVMIVFFSLLRRGDKFCMVNPEDGGYPGSSHLGFASLAGFTPLYFPYDKQRINIDLEKAKQLLEESRPHLSIFGASFIPFPQPVKELSKSSGMMSTYDGSHVLGLIAGGSFQQPLAEGCGVLFGSTHKSFWGPQGGIIIARDENMFSKIHANIHPSLVDNAHWNRIAALTYALIESLHFGKEYAKKVIDNSKALAKALNDEGIIIKGAQDGFTASHQVIVDKAQPEASQWPKLLEQVNIIVDNGIRLGTSEVTRLGMDTGEMEEIASIFSQIVKRRISKEDALKRVSSLRTKFQEVQFTFPP